MTDGDGKPMCWRYSSDIYRQKLKQGDNAEDIARRLTMSIYRSNADRDGFNRQLMYPDIGIV
jgi:hypothetical protein